MESKEVSIEFHKTMDPHAMNVIRKVGTSSHVKHQIGSIQWHSEKRFVIHTDILSDVTLSELKTIVAELEKK